MKNLLLIVFCLMGLFGYSHEIRPAFLQIKEVQPETYEVFWRIPSRGEAIPKLEVIFPNSSSISTINPPSIIDGFAVFTYQVHVPNGLPGKSLRIEGLKNTLIDALVRIEYLSGEEVSVMLQPDKVEFLVAGETSTMQIVELYTVLGIEHILFGFDHLLFVLALVLIAKDKWKILKTITAFTLAHSITLTLASLDLVYIPGAPVEAVIALSIVFLALEIVQLEKGKATLTSRMPWIVAFSFGLLHGFGFAGALSDIGLPQQAIPWALGFFNLGVELGQIAFVLVVFVITYFASKSFRIPRWTNKLVAYGIGSIASFWMIERVVGFWS